MTIIKLSVPDMSCGHCEKSIKEKLSDAKVSVDLKAKTIEVEGKSAEEVIHALDEIGFSSTLCN